MVFFSESEDSSTTTSDKVKEVSSDVIYQEKYQEMRRHRDYELTVSTWYTTILLAIAGVIFTAKFTDTSSTISSLLTYNYIIKIFLFIVDFVIMFSGCYSVWYSHDRYESLRKFMNDFFEPKIPKFDPRPMGIKPYQLIIITQIVLFFLICLAIFIPNSFGFIHHPFLSRYGFCY
jgi:hypothetical protein